MFDLIFLFKVYDMNHLILEPGSPLPSDQKSTMLFLFKFGWSFVLFHEWDSRFILRMVMDHHQLRDKWASGLLTLFTLPLWRKYVAGTRVVETFTPLVASMVHTPNNTKIPLIYSWFCKPQLLNQVNLNLKMEGPKSTSIYKMEGPAWSWK